MKKWSLAVIFLLVITSASYSIISAKKSLPKELSQVTAESLAKKCGGAAVNGEENSATSRYCYLDYFKKVILIKGPQATIEQLKQWAKVSTGLNGECHNVGHYLGQFAWMKFGMNAFKGDLTVCAFSYGHGILQSATKELSRKTIIDKFSNICVGTSDIPGCLHGIGHTLMDVKFNAEDASQFCMKEAAAVSTTYDQLEVDTRSRTCMEGWAMEDFALSNNFWVTVNTLQGAIEKCKGLNNVPTSSGCIGSEARNYIVAPDQLNTPKDWFEIRVDRLEKFGLYCRSLDTKQKITGCMNYVGLTGAEVYTLDMQNIKVAPKIEALCKGYALYCMDPFLNSRFNRYGNSDKLVRPICAYLSDPADEKSCNLTLDRFVAEAR